MSDRILAAFATEHDLVAAARAATAAGLEVVDTYAPYPIANLVPEVADTTTSGVARAALAGGSIGGIGGLLFQAWTSAVSWPMDVGGKPTLAWLSFVPVAFELMVLGAGIAAAWAFFRCMQPGPAGVTTVNRLGGHRFVIEIRTDRGPSNAREILRDARGLLALAEFHAIPCVRALPPDVASIKRLDWILIAVVVSALTLAALLWPNTARRNVTYAPDMAASPAVGTYEAGATRADAISLRAPVPGTVARGVLPMHFEASEADALRAGAELSMPASIAEETERAHVAQWFAAFCQPCHGRDGHGDGITIKRGFQPPPSLLTQRARDMKDGQMFHVLTYSQKLMPSHASQLAPHERWRLIKHVRRLQERLPVDPPPFGAAETSTQPAP